MGSVCWFRKGLRLHDNPALLAAIEEGLPLLPIFVLDPWFVTNARVGPNRWRFLQQTLTDLDKCLRNIGSRLLFFRGTPHSVFEKLINEKKINKITWEHDIEPYAIERDAKIEKLAKDNGIKVIVKFGHTLYSPVKLLKNCNNKIPLTYQAMLSLMSRVGPPDKPAETLQNLPSSCRMISELLEDDSLNPPSLLELGVKEGDIGSCLYPGGETEALIRLKVYMSKKSWVRSFEKPKTEPNSIEPSTTVLSPYLKFGCLSAKVFYFQLIEIYKEGKHSAPPVSLLGQLYWREFYYAVAADTPNFDKMIGNPICKQIPWSKNEKYLNAWKNAQTGYPFIDAIMTQLKQEGWIHHLARHAVACFLTRGDLWQSWEDGMNVFEDYLLDADWALNAGNWMWLSASAFFHQYFRVYSPIAFGKHTDQHGDYIRKYLPVLKKYPEKYIYEPWKAPLQDQKAANCIIGKDYPRPIVDHDIVRKENLSKMALAYKAGKAEKRPVDSGESSSSKNRKR